MKITDIQTLQCWDGIKNSLFLQVFTDEGIVGTGEPYSIGPNKAVIGFIDSTKSWFVGQDPTRIAWLLQRARNDIRFPVGAAGWAALSGIDHALWDIAGKAKGVPTYMLLGGKFRDKVRVYHGVAGQSPEELTDGAHSLTERGYTAFKISFYNRDWRSKPWNRVVREAVERIEALRTAVGPDADIGLEAHAVLREPSRAMQLAEALAPYRMMFMEEPVRPEHVASMARLRDQLPIALATGENLFGLSRFVDLIDSGGGGVDIIQPDLSICGGLLEAKKIAGLAEANYVTVAPHNALGLFTTETSVHLAASIPNFAILEYNSMYVDLKGRFVDEQWTPVDGYMPLPTRPGLGLELNVDEVEKNPPKPWNRGFATYPDGSSSFI